jgi:hypothetical protein
MHIEFANALVIAALVSAVVLVLGGGDRTFPLLAAITATIEGLIAFHIISLSSGKFRIDLILPALMFVAGAICWSRSSTKSTITAGTIISLVALVQVLGALSVLH